MKEEEEELVEISAKLKVDIRVKEILKRSPCCMKFLTELLLLKVKPSTSNNKLVKTTVRN